VGRLREDPLELERVLDSGIWVLEPGMALGGVGSGEVGGIGDGAVDVGCERWCEERRFGFCGVKMMSAFGVLDNGSFKTSDAEAPRRQTGGISK